MGRTPRPVPGRRHPVAVALVLLGFVWATYALHAGLGWGGTALDGFYGDWVYTGLMWSAAALVAARAVLVARERLAWALLAAGLVAWALGDLLWTVHFNAVGTVPVPSLPDLFYYLEYPLTYAGLVLLMRARLPRIRTSFWIDGLVVGLALCAGAAALVFDPLVSSAVGGQLAVATTLGYPIADLVTLCLAVVAVGLTGWRPGRALTAFVVYLLLIVVADVWFSYDEATTGTVPAIVNTLWPAGALCLAIAAWQPWPRLRPRQDDLGLVVLPGVSALFALGLLLYGTEVHVPRVAAVLAAGALLVASVRGALTFRENLRLLRRSREEAMTDALTGLGNRRHLLEDLEHALADATREDPRALVFCDLNGFKQYNDRFGHTAGDALLARLARELEGAAGDDGTAYRIGGDEFCVLLGRGAPTDPAMVAHLADSLSATGEGFTITTAIGLVTLPADASTVTRALQLADQRMYDQKGSGRPNAQRQARDLLVQIVAEREPLLRDHIADVAELAIAVGRRLGLESEALDEVARGAELHDIGKIAVPDAILHKPGPLDETEWRIMREHTVIGERILASHPAMEPVARIVRSSHERWDGGGYPDGLAGAAIPIGARIVAVCDAYDAMVSARPYSKAVAGDEAMAELRRCAGAQFDPAVVAAFGVERSRPRAQHADVSGAPLAEGQRQRT